MASNGFSSLTGQESLVIAVARIRMDEFQGMDCAASVTRRND
jgi:hypothetical protein